MKRQKRIGIITLAVVIIVGGFQAYKWLNEKLVVSEQQQELISKSAETHEVKDSLVSTEDFKVFNTKVAVDSETLSAIESGSLEATVLGLYVTDDLSQVTSQYDFSENEQLQLEAWKDDPSLFVCTHLTLKNIDAKFTGGDVPGYLKSGFHLRCVDNQNLVSSVPVLINFDGSLLKISPEGYIDLPQGKELDLLVIDRVLSEQNPLDHHFYYGTVSVRKGKQLAVPASIFEEKSRNEWFTSDDQLS